MERGRFAAWSLRWSSIKGDVTSHGPVFSDARRGLCGRDSGESESTYLLVLATNTAIRAVHIWANPIQYSLV